MVAAENFMMDCRGVYEFECVSRESEINSGDD